MGSDHDASREAIGRALRRREFELRGMLSRFRGLMAEDLRTLSGESTVDNHPADLSTDTYERERDLGRSRSVDEELREVLQAERRLAAGRYGLCLDCGTRIDPARLASLPEAALCLGCQEQRGAGAFVRKGETVP